MTSLRKKDLKNFSRATPLKGREKFLFIRCLVHSKASKLGLHLMLTGSLRNKAEVKVRELSGQLCQRGWCRSSRPS